MIHQTFIYVTCAGSKIFSSPFFFLLHHTYSTCSCFSCSIILIPHVPVFLASLFLFHMSLFLSSPSVFVLTLHLLSYDRCTFSRTLYAENQYISDGKSAAVSRTWLCNKNIINSYLKPSHYVLPPSFVYFESPFIKCRQHKKNRTQETHIYHYVIESNLKKTFFMAECISSAITIYCITIRIIICQSTKKSLYRFISYYAKYNINLAEKQNEMMFTISLDYILFYNNESRRQHMP